MNAIAPPSGYRIQQAMSAAMAFREQMCADLDNTDDEALLLALDSETDALDLLRLVLRSVAVGSRRSARRYATGWTACAPNWPRQQTRMQSTPSSSGRTCNRRS